MVFPTQPLSKLRHHARHAIRVGRSVQQQMIEDRCTDSAAALTFASLMALVPMITVLYAVLALMPSLHAKSADIQAWIFSHFLPSSGIEIQNYLQSFSQQASHLTNIGLVMLFATALTMMRRIEHSLNFIWHVPQPRKGVEGFMRYWTVLTLGPLLFGLGLALTSYIASLKFFSDTLTHLGIARYLLDILPFLCSWSAFSLIYVIVPNCDVPIKKGILGGLMAALVFELGKRGFTLFVVHFGSYQLIYGAFAALPLFLLWLYVSWIIFLLGAVLTRTLTINDGSL